MLLTAQDTRGNQKSSSWGLFTPTALWVLGIQLWLSVLIISALTLRPSQLQCRLNSDEQG